MPSLISTLGIDKLPKDEQLRLVDEILENLGENAPTSLTEAQQVELQRRIAALDANLTTVSSWEEVEARILARLRT